MSESKLAGQFFDAAIALLERVRDEESGNRAAAGAAIADTVATSALRQATMAAAVEQLLERGIEPPMLRSGNVDGGHE